MLPDWIAEAGQKASLPALRIILCVAASGRPDTDGRGRRVITARLSYRQLRTRCRLAMTSITLAVRQAREAGWLEVRPSISREASSVFTIPVTLTAPENGALHGGEGNGGGDTPGINTESVYRDITPHHHDRGLREKLEGYGFGDAARFIARNDPDRIRAAVEFVESLEGVRSRGAMIRLTVERPGEIPKPGSRYYRGKLGHLVSR